jgi:predicted metal-dependent TIM-barrel fold hydrolase
MQMIDSHTHVESRDREELELMSLAGIKAVVTMVWYPTIVFDSRALFDYFDRATKWEPSRTKAELFDTYAGVGISMVSVPTDWEKVIEQLPKYLKEKNVVCIGEIGIEPSSQTCRDLSTQEEIVKAQLKIAREHNVPVVFHTPFLEQKKWIEKYATLINDARVDKSKVILDHMTPSSVKMAWDTGCFAGITVQPWRKVTPLDAAKVVEAGENLDRLVLDSDCSARNPSDPLSVPKAVHEMRKLGIKDTVIQKVVLDNPTRFYNLPY